MMVSQGVCCSIHVEATQPRGFYSHASPGAARSAPANLCEQGRHRAFTGPSSRIRTSTDRASQFRQQVRAHQAARVVYGPTHPRSPRPVPQQPTSPSHPLLYNRRRPPHRRDRTLSTPPRLAGPLVGSTSTGARPAKPGSSGSTIGSATRRSSTSGGRSIRARNQGATGVSGARIRSTSTTSPPTAAKPARTQNRL